MENIDTRATAFGRVLGALMEARGIPAEPEEMRALAERSGFDGGEFLALATSDSTVDIGPLSGLDTELALAEEEMTALALAYVFGRDIGDEAERDFEWRYAAPRRAARDAS